VPEALARQVRAAPPLVPVPVPVPAPQPRAAPAAQPKQVVVVPSGARLLVPQWVPPPSPALPIAWGVSLAAVLCGLAFLLIDHAAIAAAWPPMQRLYGLIRLS
jgi:hypothetical protein